MRVLKVPAFLPSLLLVPGMAGWRQPASKARIEGEIVMRVSAIGRWLGRTVTLIALAFGVLALGGTAASADVGETTYSVQTGIEWN